MAGSALSDSLAHLYRRQAFGIKFGLETEQALLNRLDHPESGLVFIHVAGTNGKGSVCAMLESILRAAGLATGLYTSPHLIRLHERIRVNGACLADQELIELIKQVEAQASAVARRPGGPEVTFFEFVTAMALEYFRRRKVQVVIWETGLGGRLDATNVVTPLLSVITGISLEHTAYLGPDLASIAREKAGIIKAGRPVVLGPMADESLAVIRSAAGAQKAQIISADQTVTIRRQRQNLDGQKIRIESACKAYGVLTLPLLGAHQLVNAAIAVTAYEEFANLLGIEPDEPAVKRGLASVRWPGRLQVISRPPPLIVDGAHNPEAAEILDRALAELLPDSPLGLVMGLCQDKDLAGFMRPLARRVKRCWAVPLNSERSRLPAEIAGEARRVGWPVAETTVPQALAEAQNWAAGAGGTVCVAGSLFLAGEVLALRIGAENLFA